jgi:hypothetical protein
LIDGTLKYVRNMGSMLAEVEKVEFVKKYLYQRPKNKKGEKDLQ